MKRSELKENGYGKVKTSSMRGYTSRRTADSDRVANPYKGRYGEGYTVLMPRWDTSRYCFIEYWVK